MMMTTEATFWDELAEEYARKPVANPDAFDRKIEITRSLMRPTDAVLDIGCGTGSLALRLADACEEVHGLDVSGEMIRIANEKTEKAGAENVHFHVGPFDGSTPFADSHFDGICAYSILHLVEERRAALEQIYRLLKPGGFFVSSTVCLGGSWIPYRPILSVMRWFGKAPRVAIFSLDELVHDMAEAGFVDIATPDVGADATTAFVVAAKP